MHAALDTPKQRGYTEKTDDMITEFLEKEGIERTSIRGTYIRARPSHPLDQEITSTQVLCYTVFRGPLA